MKKIIVILLILSFVLAINLVMAQNIPPAPPDLENEGIPPENVNAPIPIPLSEEICNQERIPAICYIQLAISTNTLEYCNKIPPRKDGKESESGKDVCYMSFALNSSNLSICDEIPLRAPYWKLTCYRRFAVEKEPTTELCDKIVSISTDTAQHIICYTELARILNDSTTCRKISDEKFRIRCYDQFKKKVGDSCTNNEECASGLSCIDNICIKSAWRGFISWIKSFFGR